MLHVSFMPENYRNITETFNINDNMNTKICPMDMCNLLSGLRMFLFSK